MRICYLMAAGIVVVTLTGCTAILSKVEFKPYEGPQSWPTGGAFISDLDGVPLYEGLPHKPYEVIGLLDAYEDEKWFRNSANMAMVKRLVKEHEADALLWLSNRVINVGQTVMVDQNSGLGQVVSGSSAGGRVLRAGEPSGFRNSLVLIRFK